MIFWNIHDEQGAFFADSLLKGHRRSFETTNIFFANNSSSKTDRTLGIASLCLSHQIFAKDASTVMQHDLCISVITWPWREVRFWPWPFKVKQHIFRSDSTRETWWRHCRFLTTSVKFWPLMTSRDPNIALREKCPKYFQTFLLRAVKFLLPRLSNPLCFRVRKGW